MIESYGYSNCTSCKKTEAQISDSGVAHIHRDFFRDRFSRDELRSLLHRAQVNPSEVLSKRSKVFRANPDAFEGMDDEALLEQMINEPTLLRRPIVFDQTGVVVGHNETKLAALIDRAR